MRVEENLIMFHTYRKVPVIIGIVLCLFSSVFAYSGGSGEPSNPYQIATKADLLALAGTPTDYNKCFILTADIDLDPNLPGGQVWTTAIIAADTVTGNYSFEGTAFTGTFDGNGHKITQFTINGGSNYYLGLFGKIDAGGSVKNLGLENCSVSGFYFVGGLVGRNSGIINDCYSTGAVSGTYLVGGLVGRNDGGNISNCYSTGAVSGTYLVGGLVGYNEGGSVGNCYSTGTVSGTYDVGGLVGDNNGNISNCYSTGIVSGGFNSWNVGGLVGSNYYKGTITNCYATGAVTGGSSSGGLVGSNYYKGIITNCYAAGAVNGYFDVGGLVGDNEGNISNCYSTGAVSGTYDVGGLVGYRYGGSISNCYSTGAVSGTYDVGGLVGYNGGGTITTCYATGAVIGSGNQDYKGVGGLVGRNYNGNITACYATGAVNGYFNVGGLVGYNSGGTITTCYATGAVIGSGNQDCNGVGGLVGYNSEGTITTCYATGAVTGGNYVGGLVGRNYYSGTITNCYATGAVTGGNYIGGLVGCNDEGTITTCYATGAVTGGNYVGGLVGQNYRYIYLLYPYNKSNITACFWDIETSGRTTSAGGTSKTTAQMKTLSTFTSAGWDFVGETANGIKDIWTICEGVNYPRFAWQNQPPIADAGHNQTVYAWIDGIAEVTLDGSGSNDPDCNELTYIWRWAIDGNTYEANGISPVIELPAGEHTIELIVNDGLSDSEPNYVDVNVIAPLKAGLDIIPPVINRSSHLRNIMAVMELPRGIKKADVKNEPFVLYPAGSEEGIEAARQYICTWRYGVKAVALFSKDELMDVVPDNGRVKLQVVGRLNSGQYFLGNDIIMIIGRH